MDYFKTIRAHIAGWMDIDAVPGLNSHPLLISLGTDDLVTWRNLSTDQSSNLELENEHGFSKIALHPSGTKFLVGGPCKKVCEYSTITKQFNQKLCDSLGSITDIKYSPSGRYVGVATQDLRLMIFDAQNGRKMKCRPGHQNKIYNAFFSSKDKYVASIGEDCHILIYELSPEKDPQEVFRTKFTNQSVPSVVQGCFSDMKEGYRVFVPGTVNLQIIEQLANRWEIKESKISHASAILVAQVISPYALATSCKRDLCIWSIANQEKLMVLEEEPLGKIIPISNSFIGHRDDGLIYVYNRPLPAQPHEPNQQIQAEQNDSRIQFQNEGQENIDLEYDQQEGEQQIDYEKQVQLLTSKKKVADKIIKVYPQGQLSRSTEFFDENRFLYMNMYGFVYETREVDDTLIYAQFNRKNEKQPVVKQLFRNKKLTYFDMNSQAVCYASQNQYGLKIDTFSSWEMDWFDIQGVALSGNWMAVANLSQIRFMDISGTLIKSVCFDRPIIAMQAYQNLLTVVYHESIPMYESQLLAMRIFNVNQFSVLQLSDCHVPITVPEIGVKGCGLRWFGFSQEGMIFSQDTFGAIRAYSLETNEWTPLVMDALADPKKAWVVGFEKGQMIYWRTTDSEPEPTVRPRLNLKNSVMMLETLQEQGIEELRALPVLMWKRYCLDHEFARWRLWGRLKAARNERHINYELSANIQDEKKLQDAHMQLDVELFKIIKYYLKSQQVQKALGFIKSHIRSLQAGKDLIEMLDSCNHRNEAVDLEYFYDEKQREIEYDAIQELALKELKSKAEVSIRAKKENPMNPKTKKQVSNPIPYNIPSQPSQASSVIMEDITHKSQQSSRMEEVIENPFLKKKSTNDRKQEIEEHIEKYGVKRKVQEKKGKY